MRRSLRNPACAGLGGTLIPCLSLRIFSEEPFYTLGFFTTLDTCDIVISEIWAMPGKEKEMIRTIIPFMSKSEYKDLSLGCFDLEQRSPLSCPYETTKPAFVIRIPK